MSMSHNNISTARLGFGTWPIGGMSYGLVDQRESLRALEFAHEKGIIFFDSANIYGNGRSELLLGQAFGHKRSSVAIATKAGYVCYQKRQQNFGSAALRLALEESLRRLRRECVDILYLHSPPRHVIKQGEAFETLCLLKKEGKILKRGVSVRTPDDGRYALLSSQFESIQVVFNLLDQRAIVNSLIRDAQKTNVEIVAKAPLANGFLTGKYKVGATFGANDHRSAMVPAKRDAWARFAPAFEFLWADGARSPAQAALQFVLNNSNVVAIPGMKTVTQVQENIGAATLPFLPDSQIQQAMTTYQNIASSLEA